MNTSTPTRVFAIALSLAALSSCGDDDGPCGPGAALADGFSARISADQAVSYESFTSSPNNDCTPAGGGPTSITLDGAQVGQENFHVTFCLPRPDRIGASAIVLSDTELVEIIDVNARLAAPDDGCLLVIDRARPATGTITFVGYCADGLDAAGYAVELSGSIPGTRICTGGDAGTESTPVDIAVTGQVSVSAL